jgi:hypothetical protein
VTAQATLDVVPVYARVGAIVPMLSPDVETVVTPGNGGVISEATRANYLAVDVFAGGQTSVQLDDGTVLAQSAPADAFDPGPASDLGGAIPMVDSVTALADCSTCAYDDPVSHTWSVSVQTQADTITAGPLTLTVSGSPIVKRFLFRVRH